MAKRGFIVAIEDYAQMSEGLAKQLPGTHDSALAFRRWLIDEQDVAESDIFFCTEKPDLEGRTADATRNDIVREIGKLITAGQDETEQFFFYFAGHGFGYTDVDETRLANVLVGADYSDRLSGSGTCLSIDEIQNWLRLGLGPEDHFYFLDCCRNLVSRQEIRVGPIGPYPRASNGFPTVYTLYSTTEGQVAAVESGFADVLVDGLKGTGRAKVWHGPGMAVLFRSVKDYVAGKLTSQPVDARQEGSNDGVIRTIAPPPRYTCKVVVTNADPGDTFRLEVTDSRGRALAPVDFTGPAYDVKETPDDYQLALSAPAASVVPLDPLPADLYQDSEVRFEKRALDQAEPPSVSRPVPTTVLAPTNATVVLRDLTLGEEVRGSGEFTNDLTPGRYEVEVLDERDTHVHRREVELVQGQPMTVDLVTFRRSPLRDSVLGQIPGQHDRGAVDFSESMGLTPDQKLDFWLATIGAARILQGEQDDFSKLAGLPLASFDAEPRGASPLYLLAGFDTPETRLAIGVSDDERLDLTDLPSHDTIPGLFELPVRELGPGSHYLTLSVDAAAPLTLPICTLSNRATLVTLSRGARDALVVQQFVLPIPHLTQYLEYPRPLGDEPPLRLMRRLVHLQRQFAASRRLSDVLTGIELLDLLHVKWFEPVSCSLAAYELARRGQAEELETAVENLRLYFGDLPDTEAIAKIAGLEWSTPAAPPLVLDGLLVLDELREQLPLPAEELDYRGPWTAWRRSL